MTEHVFTEMRRAMVASASAPADVMKWRRSMLMRLSCLGETGLSGGAHPVHAEGGRWRPEPESNRRARICSPLRNHSAIGPGAEPFGELARSVKSGSRGALQWGGSSPVIQPGAANAARLSMNGGWRTRARPILSSLNFRCISGI